MAQSELSQAGCGKREAWQGLAQHGKWLPCAHLQSRLHPLLKTTSSTPMWSCGWLWQEGVFHGQCEFGQKSGLSPRLSIPMWPVPSCTVGWRAWLTGAIPAWLCLPGFQPQAARDLLSGRSGHLSSGSGSRRWLFPLAQILPARPPAAAVNKRHPHCPPEPDLLSQSSCPNRPEERRQVFPHTTKPWCDSVPACRRHSQPCSLATNPASPRQGDCGTMGANTVAGCWSQGTELGRLGRGQGNMLPWLDAPGTCPSGRGRAGAKQPFGKSQQDLT